ncbi:Oidioi.mRNA.OKI2018_I69.PAR.g8735.t1.cds [Oikopleura dioica]|uniref:Oidioi.mRNA.OKI2018_I69.PAR.g8735.t1.cds n=1 Tax=Oikopleura dioica TaxID=34765 RepID=A0ABN7RLM4_OIKDI|nr:Oidioi.mRNA.OKI2018_I69.PAR.g8735.t1.cds [Oikopleura dioica]
MCEAYHSSLHDKNVRGRNSLRTIWQFKVKNLNRVCNNQLRRRKKKVAKRHYCRRLLDLILEQEDDWLESNILKICSQFADLETDLIEFPSKYCDL